MRTLAPGFQAVYDDYGFDSDLFDILCKVHAVTQGLNTVNPPKSEAIPLGLRERIRSVQYYFLSTEKYDDVSGSGDLLLNSCRLGILVFVGIIQNDFWIPSISRQLICKLKSCLQNEGFETDSKRALRLWLIFLAGSLIPDPTDKVYFVSSIAETASQLSLSNWCEAKLLLGTFAWAGKVQDKSGRDLWDAAMSTQRVYR